MWLESKTRKPLSAAAAIPAARGNFWQQLWCRLRGHRNVEPATIYSAWTSDGAVRELHYCATCGCPVWRDHPAGQPDDFASSWRLFKGLR